MSSWTELADGSRPGAVTLAVGRSEVEVPALRVASALTDWLQFGVFVLVLLIAFAFLMWFVR